MPRHNYQRPEPEKDLLYRVLAAHVETFLQHTRTTEHWLPSNVEGKLRPYMECVIPAYGFSTAALLGVHHQPHSGVIAWPTIARSSVHFWRYFST